ncbi:MAG: hypothetical protein LUD02_07030 [Tannerellaceae bacterium]|nr:hypothetical protein [Tannerellaceae bacterium]MCD8263929.1 hypothetical protein [Tannerellaceae bacterium]
MKRFVLMLIIMATGGLTLFAQNSIQPEKSKKQIKKEMEAARDSILFRQAVEVIENAILYSKPTG